LWIFVRPLLCDLAAIDPVFFQFSPATLRLMFVAALKSIQKEASIASAEFSVGRDCEINRFQRRRFRELKVPATKYAMLAIFVLRPGRWAFFFAVTRESDRQRNS
jgi:hypothetical protein